MIHSERRVSKHTCHFITDCSVVDNIPDGPLRVSDSPKLRGYLQAHNDLINPDLCTK